MKKHQIAAMLLSALSAGVLISCSKTDESTDNVNEAESTEVDTAAPVNKDGKSVTSNKTTASMSTLDVLPETRLDYLNHVATDVIVPTYQNAAQQSQQLHQLALKLCQDGKESGQLSGAELDALREQWLLTAQAWATAESINFGPAMESMSNLYINYYPDERGLVHKGVVDLIAINPELTAEQLAQESAIVQGIPGLEEVLYANQTLDGAQCRYVMSASSALATRLDNVAQVWQAEPQTLLGLNGEDKEAAATLGMNRWINSLLALIETTKSNSLDKPLGLTGNVKGHLPAASAGQSRAIIKAKLVALNTALTDPALVTILATNNQDTLSDEIARQLASVSSILAEMPADIADADSAEQQALYDELTQLTKIIKRQLMPLLNVQVGFNSTDGD